MKQFVILLVILICYMLLLPVACTNQKGAVKVLEDQGYTNIKFTGYRYWICGEDYTFTTGFEANSVIGKPVTGAVCEGFMKGASIKLDD